MEELLIVGYQEEYIMIVIILIFFFVKNYNNDLPSLLNQNNRLGITFNGNYTKQNKIGFAHGTVINIYIVYKLKNRTVNSPDFTVQNRLFGAVKITKNVNTSHYK